MSYTSEGDDLLCSRITHFLQKHEYWYAENYNHHRCWCPLEFYASGRGMYPSTDNITEAVMEQTNVLITTNHMFASEIGKTATTWSKDETLGALKRILIVVDNALDENISEKIRNKYTTIAKA